MKKSNRKPYSTSLKPDIIKKLKLLAIEKNTTDNRIIEMAILHYIKEKGKS